MKLTFFVSTTVLMGASAFQPLPRHHARSRQLFSSPSDSSTLISVDESTPRDIASMEEWAAACGVQRAEGFELYSEDGYDISVMTTQDLPAESPVLSVPANMIFSSNAAIQEFGGCMEGGPLEDAEKLINSLNASDQLQYFYLMLKILVEYEKGDESPWYPWLNSLPRYFSNGASMTPFCFTCLPPLAASLALQERTHLLNFLNLDKVPFLSLETKGNENAIKWAFQIAYTRSFPGPDGDLRIIPMGDFFNHGSMEPEIELRYDDEGNAYAYTTRDVPAGSPLRMSYGDPTNPSFLFARYGFLDESSPATFCKIIPAHVDDKLRNMGYAHNRMLFYKDTGDVSPEVWDVLLYQILGSNAARRREFYNAHVTEDYETKQAFLEQYWPEISAKLLEHIDTFVQELDKLSSKAYDKDVNEHPRLPLILKHNEFVRNTFLTVRSRYFE